MPTRKLRPLRISRRVDGFVSQAVRDAVKEMSVDQKTADPGFVIHPAAPTTQNIYFADGGRPARGTGVAEDAKRPSRSFEYSTGTLSTTNKGKEAAINQLP